jgi:hypothetical protein
MINSGLRQPRSRTARLERYVASSVPAEDEYIDLEITTDFKIIKHCMIVAWKAHNAIQSKAHI